MKLLIRILLSLAMLTLALRLVDLNELKQSLLNIPLPTLGMVVVIFFLGQLLSSYKWWLLVRSGSIEAPWLLAVRAYFLGMAVNCFGLGTVGFGARTRARKQVKTENHRAGLRVCRPSPWDHRSSVDRRSFDGVFRSPAYQQ